MRIKNVFRGLTALVCGACLLQTAGCTVDALILELITLSLNAVLTQLISAPIL